MKNKNVNIEEFTKKQSELQSSMDFRLFYLTHHLTLHNIDEGYS